MVFKWLKNLFGSESTEQVTEQVTEQATEQVTEQVTKKIEASNESLMEKASETQKAEGLSLVPKKLDSDDQESTLKTTLKTHAFDPQHALQRVTKTQAQKLSKEQNAETNASNHNHLSELKDLATQLNHLNEHELIVINHGRQKSLCLTKDLGSSAFGQATLAEQHAITTLSSFDELLAYLSNKATPLYRDQLLKMISPLSLRLPQVSELQALYAANELASDTVYWTRDARDRLYSPSEGRFRSVKQSLKVKLALFFADEALNWDELADKPYTEIDAQASLATLASDAMDKLNFGLFEDVPNSETDASKTPLSNAPAFQLEAKSEEVKLKGSVSVASSQVTQPRVLAEEYSSLDLSQYSELQQALFSELPAEYITHIQALDTNEQLMTKLLTIIKSEQKISSKDLSSQFGISMIVASLNLGKLDRVLKEHNLAPLVANRFETTRTAPTTGTYFTWLLA